MTRPLPDTIRICPTLAGHLGVDQPGFEAAAHRIGLRFIPMDDAGDADATLVGPDTAAAVIAALGARDTGSAGPLLSVEPSHLPHRWRLAHFEWADARGAVSDTRLQALLAGRASHLDERTVAALLGDFPPVPPPFKPPRQDAARSKQFLHVDDQLQPSFAEALSPLLGDLVVPVAGVEQAAAVITSDYARAATALLSGREVIAAGPSPLAAVGLVHPAPTPAALAEAVVSLAGPRRNDRDRVRRAAAADTLFNAFPLNVDQMFAALDLALRDHHRGRARTVSIVITSHNYAAYLPDAVESARRQSEPAHEIIVVDDGSTDGSADMVRSMDGIVAIVQQNGGQASAMNAGFAASTGDIVVFLDADDLLMPNAVARIARADWRGTARLTSALHTIDAGGRPIGLYKPLKGGAPAPTGFLGGAVMAGGIVPFAPTSANAFRRETLAAVMPIPIEDFRISADLYLVLASAALGETLALPKPIAAYRIHGNNRYFEITGAGLHAEPRRQRQRRAAWRALRSKPPDGLSAAFCEEMVRAMDTLLDSTVPDRLHRPRPLPGEHPPPWQDGDRATWPFLALGETVSLAGPFRGCGRGFGAPAGNGTPIIAERASLCLRVPHTQNHLRLTIGYSLEGTDVESMDGAVLLSLDLWGTDVDAVCVERSGTLRVELPAELLRDWHDVVPHTCHAAKAVLLGLTVHMPDDARFALEWLHVAPLPSTPAPAPLLETGRWHILAGNSANALPGAAQPSADFARETVGQVLGDGWTFPGETEVPLKKGVGELYFTPPSRAPFALCLLVRTGAPLDTPPATLAAEEKQLDLITAPIANTPFVVLSALLDEIDIGLDGTVQVVLTPSAHPQTGLPRQISLCAVRVDLTHTAGPKPALLPFHPQVGAGFEPFAVGLQAVGEDAALSERFRLPLPPRTGATARANLAIDAATDLPAPTPLRLALDGRTVTAWLGPTNTVSIDLSEASDVLEGEFPAGASAFVLRQLTLVAPPLLPGRASGYPVTAADLIGCALDPSTCRLSDDAVWLTTPLAGFLLPAVPTNARLSVHTLTLTDPPQTLAFNAGAGEATSGPSGATVLVDVASADAPQLYVRASALVSESLLGLDGEGMLAGAITRIDVVGDPQNP